MRISRPCPFTRLPPHFLPFHFSDFPADSEGHSTADPSALPLLSLQALLLQALTPLTSIPGSLAVSAGHGTVDPSTLPSVSHGSEPPYYSVANPSLSVPSISGNNAVGHIA